MKTAYALKSNAEQFETQGRHDLAIDAWKAYALACLKVKDHAHSLFYLWTRRAAEAFERSGDKGSALINFDTQTRMVIRAIQLGKQGYVRNKMGFSEAKEALYLAIDSQKRAIAIENSPERRELLSQALLAIADIFDSLPARLWNASLYESLMELKRTADIADEYGLEKPKKRAASVGQKARKSYEEQGDLFMAKVTDVLQRGNKLKAKIDAGLEPVLDELRSGFVIVSRAKEIAAKAREIFLALSLQQKAGLADQSARKLVELGTFIARALEDGRGSENGKPETLRRRGRAAFKDASDKALNPEKLFVKALQNLKVGQKELGWIQFREWSAIMLKGGEYSRIAEAYLKLCDHLPEIETPGLLKSAAEVYHEHGLKEKAAEIRQGLAMILEKRGRAHHSASDLRAAASEYRSAGRERKSAAVLQLAESVENEQKTMNERIGRLCRFMGMLPRKRIEELLRMSAARGSDHPDLQAIRNGMSPDGVALLQETLKIAKNMLAPIK